LRADAQTDVASPIAIEAGKFVLTASQAKKLLAMDRYEGRARLRLKFAIQVFAETTIRLIDHERTTFCCVSKSGFFWVVSWKNSKAPHPCLVRFGTLGQSLKSSLRKVLRAGA
jgi:hypothetical protein